MGMFDDIICEYPLPVAGLDRIAWQTKDLDCELAQYRISAEGALERMTYRYEPRTADEIVRDQREQDETGWPIYLRTERAIKNGWEAVELPRFFVLEFYGSRSGLWVSVSVLFMDGKVDQIDVRPKAISGNPADVELGFSTHDPTA